MQADASTGLRLQNGPIAISMALVTDLDALDLYDLSLLLNYERAIAEPRFSRAKLLDIASNSQNFQMVQMTHPVWTTTNGPKSGFMFVRESETDEDLLPDTPSNILPATVPAHLQSLSTKELETIYWQTRNHDGCYKSITLLQHFFDLYPDSQPLRVRTSAGVDFLTTASTRAILELKLQQPSLLTLTAVLPENMTYISGNPDRVLNHVILGLAAPGEANIGTVLDLSSLQFGDVGRGLGGKSTFVLESMEKYHDRIQKVTKVCNPDDTKVSKRIGSCPDDVWLKPVAEKVKRRWDARATDHWCGHCGAPGGELKKCSGCTEAYYCDSAHQISGWPFHKRFCAGNLKTKVKK